MADINKAGAVIIRDRKLLVSRNKGKEVYVAPGGKLEEGEDDLDALTRELQEEQSIEIDPNSTELLGEFEAIAAGDNSNRTIRMGVYIVNKYSGEPTPTSEVEENAWVDSRSKLPLGSIFEHDVIPALVKKDLID